MLIVSREIVSPGVPGLLLFFVVILTARKAVFICGETDVMVPCTIEPANLYVSIVKCKGVVHEYYIPFLSSMVTVSFTHFMRNLC